MAAAIFIGCRMAKVARSFTEIWALTNVRKKEIGKVFQIMDKIIQEKIASNPDVTLIEYDIKTSQTTAEDLIRRFCSHLGLSSQVANAAEYIARRCEEIGIFSGRSPITIAASVIYMAGMVFGIDIPSSKIADITGVSNGTIKSSYKIFYEEKGKAYRFNQD